MKCVMMTVEDALELLGKSGTVLVSVQDLEKNEECISFVKSNQKNCENILRKAETIGKLNDEFVSQLRVFTVKQVDLINYSRTGKLHTILLKE